MKKYLWHIMLLLWVVLFFLFFAIGINDISVSVVYWKLDEAIMNGNIIPFRYVFEKILIYTDAFKKGVSIPFCEIFKIFENLMLNMLLFIPFGILYTMIKRKCTYKTIIVSSLLISLCKELIKVIIISLNLIHNRIFDVDNIIANIIGALVGYIINSILNRVGRADTND